MVQRGVLAVAFLLGVAGFLVMLVPFSTSSDAGDLRCGPPLFEVLVPADPAFAVPENEGCFVPARTRLALGGFVVFVGVAVAVGAEVRGRQRTGEARERWLADERTRRRRAAGTGSPSDA